MSQPGSKAQDVRSHEDGRQKAPRWLPITLLTVTTVALTLPAVLLWRQRQALGQPTRFSLRKGSPASPPPARKRPILAVSDSGQSHANAKTSPSSGSLRTVPPPRRPIARSNVVSTGPSTKVKSTISATDKVPKVKLSEILFDGPFLSLGALGLATAAVGVGAVLGVWGVQSSMGVKNVDEFAARMRELLLKHMPAISQRIYRPSSEEDPSAQNGAQADSHQEEKGDKWRWEEAERRLGDAFDRGGVGEWAECAIRELEAEGKVERRRRGL